MTWFFKTKDQREIAFLFKNKILINRYYSNNIKLKRFSDKIIVEKSLKNDAFRDLKRDFFDFF